MNYYIGFRHGWIEVGRHIIGWHDGQRYPYLPGRTVFGLWKVWVR